jgi:hypothetical protein
MRVLVACEFSGTVRSAFSRRGHEAVSVDLLPDLYGSSDHIQDDVTDYLKREWDLVIAHPPCTYLANSGVWALHRDKERWAQLEAGAEFFRTCLEANAPRVCVENPVPHKYAVNLIGRTYDQTIQPYQFGHPESKRTCLWLRGLPKLLPTLVLPKPPSGHWDNQTPSGQNKYGPSADRWAKRSVTYTGIAEAMAEQWG